MTLLRSMFISEVHFRSEAERRFYVRPTYLLRRLLAVRSLFQAVSLIREGLSLLRRMRARGRS